MRGAAIARPAEERLRQTVTRKIWHLLAEDLGDGTVALIGCGLGHVPAEFVFRYLDESFSEQIFHRRLFDWSLVCVLCANDSFIAERVDEDFLVARLIGGGVG